MQRLAMAAGGNTVANYEGGVGMSFLGYPVVISQVLQSGGPSTDISGNIFGYFGDMSMSTTFGDKRGVTVATDSRYLLHLGRHRTEGNRAFRYQLPRAGNCFRCWPNDRSEG